MKTRNNTPKRTNRLQKYMFLAMCTAMVPASMSSYSNGEVEDDAQEKEIVMYNKYAA